MKLILFRSIVFPDLALIARTVEDVRITTKVLLGKLHSKVPLQYRDEVALNLRPKKLKFGYYVSGELTNGSHIRMKSNILSDGIVKASPACQRAVRTTVDGMREFDSGILTGQ